MKKVSKALVVGERVGRVEDMLDHDGKKIKLCFDVARPRFGVVTAVIADTDKVTVSWDAPEWDPKRVNEEIVSSKDLYLEAALKKAWSKLEADFAVIEQQVADKLKEASKLLREANKIAKKSGKELSEMYDAIGPLYSAMDACGWRTSSFGC